MNVCDVCGIPLDANYFDEASIQPAPANVGDQVELARYELHPQYCGRLLCFAQYAEPQAEISRKLVETPGYEWTILCNNQPRDPYLPTPLILNPWGENNLPIHLRLEEGCVVRLVVRRVASSPAIELARVGGRLQGRYWYNKLYGGVFHPL
jgi:hypothetical protein